MTDPRVNMTDLRVIMTDPRSTQEAVSLLLRLMRLSTKNTEMNAKLRSGLLSEGSMQELVADGFTRLQVEKLCKDGPADHRDGPPGGADGQHDGPPGMPPQ